jgi:hypothetical protein
LNAVFSCNAVSNITTTQTRITVSNFVSGNYFLGVTCWDGSIYYAPYNGTSGILQFTPSTGFQGFVGTQVSYTGSAKWYTGVMGADSNIYFFGGASTSILKYNPATATASLITIAGTGGTFAANSYRGGILGPNGRIYLSPYATTSIFWFDPATVTSGNIATNSSSSLRYEGCSMAPDGKIYMSPFSGVNTMLILDTSTGSVVYPAAGTTTAQTFRGGASLSPNGNLYFPPSVTNGNVLYYNSNTGGNLIANTSPLVYRDSHLGPDGKVYITANNGGSNVIVVNPTDNTLTNSNNALGTINVVNTSLNFVSGGSLINNGSVTINGSSAEMYNYNTVITNNGTIHLENNCTFYSSGATLNTLTGTITIDTGARLYLQDFPLRNCGTIINNARLVSSNTIFNYNGGIITNNGSFNGGGEVNNADGSGACGTGTLDGTDPITPTGTTCPPS